MYEQTAQPFVDLKIWIQMTSSKNATLRCIAGFKSPEWDVKVWIQYEIGRDTV